MQERLQKILAQAGVASRRHAEELIVAGRVTVNGQVVTELARASRTGPGRSSNSTAPLMYRQPESISTEVRFIQLSNMARRRGRPRGARMAG